jgi:hypothetical protein
MKKKTQIDCKGEKNIFFGLDGHTGGSRNPIS